MAQEGNEHTSVLVSKAQTTTKALTVEEFEQREQSFYEQCTADHVPVSCQFAEENKALSVNQCSWAAALFCVNCHLLAKSFQQQLPEGSAFPYRRVKFFVGGLHQVTRWQNLVEVFAPFGRVIDAVIMKDRQTGRTRGFGFVILDSTNEQIESMQTHEICHPANHRLDVKLAVSRDQENSFPRLYNRLVTAASHLRKQFGHYACGENIDDPRILESEAYQKLGHPRFKKMVRNPDVRDNLLEILPDELVSVFYTREETVTVPSYELRRDIEYASDEVGRCLLVSRIGQSFSLLSMGHGFLLICDSHVPQVGLCTVDDALRYVLHEHTDGFNLILWAVLDVVA